MNLPAKIQPWFLDWLAEHEASTLSYKKSAAEQVMFVRDDLSRLLYRDVAYNDLPNDGVREHTRVAPVDVIGEHHSKSVRLPVYSIDRPEKGLRLVLRDNFYDWNVSVISERPIPPEIMRGFPRTMRPDDVARMPNGYEPGRSWGYCFFQGFPNELQFGPYDADARRFSFWTGGERQIYAFVWMLTAGWAS